MDKKQPLAFYRRLQQEIESWETEGLLTSTQKEKILARYQVLQEIEERAGPKKVITTLSILGAVLAGIGVILFMASNWGAIPRWGKLGLIFIPMLASYGMGFYIRYEKRNYPKVGASLILLGTFLYGAGIFLIAQIYHISAHYPNGPLLWGLGIIPLAYLLRFQSIAFLSILIFLIWLGMEASFYLPEFDEGRFPAGGIFPILILYLMAGISLWAVGLAHRRLASWKALFSPYLSLGAFLVFGLGFSLTFMIHGEHFGAKSLSMFYLGLGILLALSFLVFFLGRDREKGTQLEGIFLGVLAFLVFYLAVLNPVGIAGFRLTANVIFALAVLVIILLGYVRRYPVYINLGLIFFALDVMARYFDFFWELLPRSLFFIIGGLMLLMGGVLLERNRRKILATFKLDGVAGFHEADE